jgi:hypothetical protein
MFTVLCNIFANVKIASVNRYYILIFLLLIPFCAAAQYPELPSMSLVTENAQNKLAWSCQYDGVKSIAIQRSADSIRNFVTIGTINNPKKGIHSFIDNRPLAGKNNYRILVLFSGDVEWYSNTYKMYIDSTILAKSLEGAIASGTTNANTNYNQKGASGTAATDFYYTPSSQIYTNPYTGHVNINLKDALTKKYSIRFYDPKKNEVLRVSRVTKTTLVLDKNNFNSPGTYNFQLFEGTTVAETGYITIY